MLALTCERAAIEDGMRILDLGCGWGSLTFWLAERYPRAEVLAVSNSTVQRATIVGEAERRGLSNVDVGSSPTRTTSIRAAGSTGSSRWRCSSTRGTTRRCSAASASWLEPDGRLFVHVFTHRRFAYAYRGGWLARNFFTGGTMPSDALLPSLAEGLRLESSWRIDGRHYALTAEAWLARLDASRDEVLAVLTAAYGAEARRRLQMWRVFLMACAELWDFRGGAEWGVSHYRFAR